MIHYVHLELHVWVHFWVYFQIQELYYMDQRGKASNFYIARKLIAKWNIDNQLLKIHPVQILSLKSSLKVPSYNTPISYAQVHLYRAVLLVKHRLTISFSYHSHPQNDIKCKRNETIANSYWMFTVCQKPFKHFTCANVLSPYDNICLELSSSPLSRSEDCGAQKFKKYIQDHNPWSPNERARIQTEVVSFLNLYP